MSQLVIYIISVLKGVRWDPRREIYFQKRDKFEIVDRPPDAWIAARLKHVNRKIVEFSAEYSFLTGFIK